MSKGLEALNIIKFNPDDVDGLQYLEAFKVVEKYLQCLEILKPYLRLVDNFLQVRVNFYDDYWLIVKEITDEEELESLKKILG